jgi:hypothetical protein
MLLHIPLGRRWTEESGVASSVVKLRPDTYARVRRLAQERNASMQEVIARGIDALERQEFARGFQDDFAALHDDAKAWKAVSDEREIWDSSLDDGLDP